MKCLEFLNESNQLLWDRTRFHRGPSFFIFDRMTMKPTPDQNRSKLSSTEPDLDLCQWERLADYATDRSFLNFYLYPGCDQRGSYDLRCYKNNSQKLMTILGVTASLLLIGSALWYRSVELNYPSPILEETMEGENAPTVNSLENN